MPKRSYDDNISIQLGKKNKNNPNKKQKKTIKNLLWVSHGQHMINDVFKLPDNVNIIFLVEGGLICQENKDFYKLLEYLKNPDQNFELYTDYPYLREHEDNIMAKATRVIYKNYRTVPNLRLGWESSDLINKNKAYWGLSQLPLKQKEPGTILTSPVIHNTIDTTLKELVNNIPRLIDDYNETNTYNIFITACRTPKNPGDIREANDIRNIVNFEKEMVKNIEPCFGKCVHNNEVYSLIAMNNYEVIESQDYNNEIKKQIIEIINKCFQQNTVDLVVLNNSMMIMTYKIVNYKVIVVGIAYVSNQIPDDVINNILPKCYINDVNTLKNNYYIHTVCINPNYRGKGQCSVLFNYLDEKLSNLINTGKITNNGVSLIVRHDNYSAIKCYKKHGFKPTPITVDWYDGQNTIYLKSKSISKNRI